MLTYTLKRAGQMVVAAIVASMIVFLLVRASGDPIGRMLPPTATADDVAAIRAALGLDQPLPIQYLVFLRNIVHGDFGTSIIYQQPALDIVLRRIPATAALATCGITLALVIALPLGVYAAANTGRLGDRVVRYLAVVGQAFPPFWLGALLLLLFTVVLRWAPTIANPSLQTIILPAITIGVISAAGLMRLTRSSMLEVLRTDFVRFARVKGAPERVVLWRHAFRNASLNLLTFGALTFLKMLTGSIVVENVFAWPGIGQLTVQSVVSRDFPVLQTVAVFYSLIYLVGSFLIDVGYQLLDPRLRRAQ